MKEWENQRIPQPPEWEDREPFEPWIPTLADVMKSWPDLGWTGLEIDSTKYPHITERKTELGTRFFERYATRRINEETLARWQLRLQNRFDEIAAEYERAYLLYEKFKEQIDSDVQLGSEQIGSREEAETVADSATKKGAGREIDTPDAIINHDKDYADRLTETEGTDSRSSARTGSGSHKLTHKISGRIIESINTSIYSYRDIDTEMMKEFENNFLNIFG